MSDTMHSVKVFVFCLFLTFFVGPLDSSARSSKYRIHVQSQQDFDRLGSVIRAQFSEGEKQIVVDFAPGKYYYKHQHLYFADNQYPETSITFRGNGATIISAGRDIPNSGVLSGYNEYAGYIDKAGNDYQNYSGMFQADTLVEILDVAAKKCRIHCKEIEGAEKSDCTNAFIRLTSWFTSYLYPVTQIESGYVYFVADNLAPGYTAYGNFNVNYDYTVGKILPRFRLINLYMDGNGLLSIKKGLVNKTGKDLHLCESGYFISLLNCELKELRIEDFNLIGCRGDCQFFRFRNLKTRTIELSNCTMSAARGMAFYADGTNNIFIKKCKFHDIYQDVIYISNNCANATVRNNTFYNNGKGVINSFCVVCHGENYVISCNDIRDFNYGAICVGIHYRSTKDSKPSNGVVEKNHIYYTDSYIKDKANWTLVDGGAIYLYTKNDGTVVRYNRIHNYRGANSNRGIYCDDGAYGFTLYGNIVTGDLNSNYIDSRLVPSADLPTNTNNVVMYNIVEGRYKFEGATKKDNGCVKGPNVVLSKPGDAPYNIILNNLENPEEDIHLEYKENKDLSIVVPRETWKQLKKLPFYGRIKKYIKH